jgi:DNA polymerase III epsilon subunit family exonuclease
MQSFAPASDAPPPVLKKGQHFQTTAAKDRESLQQHLSVPLAEGNFIVFDLETTGGNPERNGITEIFALRWHNGEVKETFYSLVNPQISIPPIVRRMTGITNQMVRNAPTIREVMPKFIEFIGNDVLVSHNTIGDMKFLVYFADRVARHQLDNFYLCTHLLSEKLLAQAPDKSLSGLTTYLNIPSGAVHRAEEDTYLTWELFKVLVDKAKAAGAETIIDTIRLQGDLNSRLRLGWSLDPELATTIPAKPGVLQFFDRHHKLLFLTSTKDLNRQFRELSNFYYLPKMLQKSILLSAHLEYCESPDLFSAMLHEAHLGAKLKQGFLPIHWHLRFLWAICAVEVGDDKIALKVAPLSAHTLAAWGPVYDRKTAQAALDALAKIAGVSCSSKHGLTMERSYLPQVSAWFSRASAKLGFSRAKLLSLKVLLSARYRQELLKEWRISGALQGASCTLKVQTLLQHYGVLLKTGQGGTPAQLIPITASQPGEAINLAQGKDWSAFLRSSEEGKALVAMLHTHAAASHEKPLSAKEAAAANAALWLIFGNKAQKNSDYRFYPLAKLPS